MGNLIQSIQGAIHYPRKTSVCILFLILLAITCCGSNPSDNPPEVFLPDGHSSIKIEPWVEGLEIPWSLVFLPDGRALVSERPGRIRLIKNGKLQEEPYMKIEVAHTGEGGLMGLAIHPDFPKKPYIYAMHTYRKNSMLYNRVIRIKDFGRRGLTERIIIDSIPGGRYHNGGRIAFGPDGMLYITTGETFQPDLSQDINSLAGKILRLTPEGGIPADNPFPKSPVYSYGHRNPQGIAWDPETKILFESEHGPSGEFGIFGHDEINIIFKGGNYGWPKVIGIGKKKGFLDPFILWKNTTPPSGIAFYKGDLFVATLRSEALIRIILQRVNKSYKVQRIERWFSENYGRGRFGRLRDVAVGPDGFLYFMTNNRDGRGFPRPGDDKIYRIAPFNLQSQTYPLKH